MVHFPFLSKIRSDIQESHCKHYFLHFTWEWNVGFCFQMEKPVFKSWVIYSKMCSVLTTKPPEYKS